MPLLTVDPTRLQVTAIASTTRKIGDLCTNFATCLPGSYVVNGNVQMQELVPGAQLQGSFQLRFNGYSTASLAFDSDAQTVQNALNNLASIAPSQVSSTA